MLLETRWGRRNFWEFNIQWLSFLFFNNFMLLETPLRSGQHECFLNIFLDNFMLLETPLRSAEAPWGLKGFIFIELRENFMLRWAEASEGENQWVSMLLLNNFMLLENPLRSSQALGGSKLLIFIAMPWKCYAFRHPAQVGGSSGRVKIIDFHCCCSLIISCFQRPRWIGRSSGRVKISGFHYHSLLISCF